MPRIDSVLVQAGVAKNLDEARKWIRAGRVNICTRSAYAAQCRTARQPHQLVRGKAWAWVGDAIIQFDTTSGQYIPKGMYSWDSPLGTTKKRKRRRARAV